MKIKIDLQPTLSKTKAGYYSVFFWYESKRFRYSSGRVIDKDINPNHLEPSRRHSEAVVLCSGEEMHQYNANTFSFSSPYRFNSKEKDAETGLYYYGGRYYNPQVSVWLSVDPRASEMPEWSPYAFSFNNPVLFVDPDGEKPTIYIEGTGGIGHAFMTVGKGDNMVVYTYGRYLGGGKGKSSANSLDPSGKGVMIKLTGAEAQRYVDHQLEDNNARGYELNDITDEDVASYYDNLMNSGRELTQEEASKYDGNQNKYGTSEDARVLNEYELMSNNCATYCTDGAEAAGTSETFSNDNTPLDKKPPLKATTPFSLMLYLENQINNNNQNVNRIENP